MAPCREKNAEYWIETLGLVPHPEGGFFCETYRAEGSIPGAALPPVYNGDRAYSTAITFLLRSCDVSRFHRLSSDEVWHFLLGAPLELHLLGDQGHRTLQLGPDPEAGQAFHAIVPGGTWFGARVLEPDRFALTACTVAPGFHDDDFELAERADLLSRFPDHEELIRTLTLEGK